MFRPTRPSSEYIPFVPLSLPLLFYKTAYEGAQFVHQTICFLIWSCHLWVCESYNSVSTLHARWIGRGGPTAWPSSSPDFNPLEVYLWGHLNTRVYAAPVDNRKALQRRTVDICQTIRNCPANGRGGPRDVSRRALNLVEDILSTYYKCTPSALNHK
jgi:hypothetical protein